MLPVTPYAAIPSRDMNANGGLARDVADGNPEAMEMLYVLLFRASRHMLASTLRDQDGDDFVHEMLAITVEAIRNGDLRDPAALPGYVKGVVRRQGAMCIVRKARARRRQVDPTSFAATNAPSDADPEADLLSQERSDMMQRGLNNLCQRDRELMTRFYLREQPFHQICEEMHLTETQFRLYKSRAKAKLTAWARTVSHS